jgi:preprotein translocase subunit YajC
MFDLISKAYAQTAAEAPEVVDAVNSVGTAAAAPSMSQTFAYNMGMVLIVVLLFYFLVIKPQQRRMKEHTDLVSKLSKGERVVMQGGLIGTIAEQVSDHEVLLDCNGQKVAVLRSAIMGKFDDMVRPLAGAKPAANDDKAKAAAKPAATTAAKKETASKSKKKAK